MMNYCIHLMDNMLLVSWWITLGPAGRPWVKPCFAPSVKPGRTKQPGLVHKYKGTWEFGSLSPQLAAQQSSVRFGGAAAFLVALSNITASPVPRQVEVDTNSHDIQKPLLTDDIPGSAPTDRIHLYRPFCMSKFVK